MNFSLTPPERAAITLPKERAKPRSCASTRLIPDPLHVTTAASKESRMSPRKIIIDTDPGQDDAVAILLALASPDDLEVLGITAVAGNVPLTLTGRNARIVC